ncbi:MAG: chemotaxis protein CheW [Roseovarius sp.]
MTDEMDEIWALYADDGAQALDAAEAALDALQDGEDPAAHIGALFRAVHTFKGNSRVLGLANVEALAHLAEDLIGLVRDDGVALTGEITDILMRSVDVLRGMLEQTADTREDVDPAPSEGLKDDLRALIGRLTGAEAETEAEDSPQTEAPTAPNAPAEPNATAPEDTTPEAEDAEQDTPQEALSAPSDAGVEAEAGPDTEAEAREEPQGEAQDEAAAPAAPPAAQAKPPAMDPALAGLLDQLDGGSGFDFDAFEEDEDSAAPETAVDDPAEPEQHDPAPAPVATLAEVTEGKPEGGLLDVDPMYRQIFTDMVSKTVIALDGAVSDADMLGAARKEADGLCYAAEQLGLGDWTAALGDFLGTEPTPETAQSACAALRDLFARDLGEADATPAAPSHDAGTDDATAFFTAMADFYPRLADIGMRMGGDVPPTPEERDALSEEIATLAEPAGLVRVVDTARTLAIMGAGPSYRMAELDFYQELVSVERTLPPAFFDDDLVAPSKLLGAWCADHVFQTLQSLREGLDNRKAAPGPDWFPDFEGFMRQVHFACLNYHIDTAAQLTMALIDLFARVRVEGVPPDVILVQMGRGFVDTMELVFDALDQGDTPDTARIEQMFEEATNACFVASGMVTAKTIETRLGLPPEFHRVLSPESVKSANEAIEEGLHFYILRADLNDDDALAQGFLEWITSGLVRMITNVTVFLDHSTLFDFLVASTLDQDQMTERLAMLDASGTRLSMARVLTVRAAEDEADQSPDADGMEAIAIGDTGDSLALLEAVGAISASHALLDHELGQLASVDLVEDVMGALRQAGVSELDPGIRSVLRERLDRHSLRLQEISESGTQLAAELSQLQQESVERRSRPADVLFRPLQAYVETRARKTGGDASMTYVGGDVVLDQMLIEDLRGLLKALINLRLGVDHAATRFHVSIEAESDHVRVEVTDNSPSPATRSGLAEIEADLQRKKGALRHARLPAGAGMRFHLKVPQHMIVLDGMVVRVGQVRYVLPIDAIQRILQTDRLMPVTAAGDARMLNMGEDGLVPVHPLCAQSGASAGDARLFVVVSSNDRRIAIPVDELLGQQLVLLRPLQGVLSSVRDMSGIAILSGGEVGMVVAVSAIASATVRAA